MNLVIPNELFNASIVPNTGSTKIRVVDYIQTIVEKLPNCADITIEREFWNTVCDFCERTGALRQKKTGTLSASSAKVSISTTDLSGQSFLRVVGAGTVTGSVYDPVSINDISVAANSSGAVDVTFSGTISTSTNAYVDYSVVPDINAEHDTKNTGTEASPAYASDKWVLPQWFLTKYDKLLVAGTNFRIMSVSNRPWTDYNAARANAFMYNSEINRVTVGLITSGMRKYALKGMELPFIGNTQAGYSQTTQTEQK